MFDLVFYLVLTLHWKKHYIRVIARRAVAEEAASTKMFVEVTKCNECSWRGGERWPFIVELTKPSKLLFTCRKMFFKCRVFTLQLNSGKRCSSRKGLNRRSVVSLAASTCFSSVIYKKKETIYLVSGFKYAYDHEILKGSVQQYLLQWATEEDLTDDSTYFLQDQSARRVDMLNWLWRQVSPELLEILLWGSWS